MVLLEVATLNKKIFKALPIIGSILVIQSLFWEYARMKPDYGFFVEPWSLKGTATNYAAVFASIGVALLVASVVVRSKVSERSTVSPAISAGIGITAVVITAAFADSSKTIGISGLGAIIVSMVLARAIVRLVARYTTLLGDSTERPTGAQVWIQRAIVTVGFLVVFLAFRAANLQLSPVRFVAVVATIIVAISVIKDPVELASNRTLILASLMALAVLAASAGGIRSNLISEQVLAGGIAAKYKDAQATGGYLFAVGGAALVLMGSISMWAQRRDLIVNNRRIKKQREAAEKSKRELEAALAR